MQHLLHDARRAVPDEMQHLTGGGACAVREAGVARRAAAAAACRCSGWISGGAPHADGAASDELGGQSASISRGGGAAGMAIGSGLKGNMAGARRQHGLLPFWRCKRNSYSCGRNS